MMAPTITAEVGCHASQKTLHVSNGKPGNLPGSAGTSSAQMFISNAGKISRVTTSQREDEVQQKLAALSQHVKTMKEKGNQHLMSICLKTLELSSKNRKLQEELNDLREQTKAFMQAVKPKPTASIFQQEMAKSLTYSPLRMTAQNALTNGPVPMNLSFLPQNVFSSFQFQNLGATTLTQLTNQPSYYPKPAQLSEVQQASISVPQIRPTDLNVSHSPNPLPTDSSREKPVPSNQANQPGYNKDTNTVQLEVGKNGSHVTLSTNTSTLATGMTEPTEVSSTIGAHGGKVPTMEPKVFCSCCPEESGRANQKNFYSMLNGIAANWANRLNVNINATPPPTPSVIPDSQEQSVPTCSVKQDGFYKKELFETISSALAQQPGSQMFPQGQLSRKRCYMSNKDEDPMISAKRKSTGSESSFGSLSCPSPLLDVSDSSGDGLESMGVDPAEVMQLTSIDELGLSDDSD